MKLSSAICKLHQLDRPMKDFKKFSNSKLLSADFENEEQDSHTSALDKLPIFASFLTQVFLIQVLLYGCIFFIFCTLRKTSGHWSYMKCISLMLLHQQ